MCKKVKLSIISPSFSWSFGAQISHELHCFLDPQSQFYCTCFKVKVQLSIRKFLRILPIFLAFQMVTSSVRPIFPLRLPEKSKALFPTHVQILYSKQARVSHIQPTVGLLVADPLCMFYANSFCVCKVQGTQHISD